jgi:hypothetical protein
VEDRVRDGARSVVRQSSASSYPSIRVLSDSRASLANLTSSFSSSRRTSAANGSCSSLPPSVSQVRLRVLWYPLTITELALVQLAEQLQTASELAKGKGKGKAAEQA